MREEELRDVLLVKTFEDADRDRVLLPPADRAAAGREAVRGCPGCDSERLLAARAGILVRRIVEQHPAVGRLRSWLGPIPAITTALVIVGFLFGTSVPLIDGPREVNVL